jgi:hypothetical protein
MYHAILGRLAYMKFMVMPNYTYLKLKIPGPRGIITVGPTYQRAYECGAECFLFAEATIRSERLHAEPPSEEQVLTPKIGTGRKLICAPSLVTNSIW